MSEEGDDAAARTAKQPDTTTRGVHSMDQVTGAGIASEDEQQEAAALMRKYGLTVPNYASSRNRSAQSTNQGPYRSVLDYHSADTLKEAMLEIDAEGPTSDDEFEARLQTIADGQPVQDVLSADDGEVVDALDWVLPKFDAETLHPQTLDEEVRRLMVLKSYNVLDQEREEAFDRITTLASRIFDVHVSVINLIDLGRLWLLSTTGLGDIREAPRKVTFCACKSAQSDRESLSKQSELLLVVVC